MTGFADFRDHMLSAPRKIEPGLTEGGSWRPILTFETGAGRYAVPVEVPLEDPGHWERAVAGRLSELLVEREARYYGLVGLVWFIKSVVEDFADVEIEVLQRPDRQEGLVVHIARSGHAETYLAKVERPSGAGPKLGPWMDARGFVGLGVGPLDAIIGS
jgi:hypothetical protein